MSTQPLAAMTLALLIVAGGSPARAAQPLTASKKDLAMLAPWKGPYGGVPAWSKVNPADFPAAYAVACLLYTSPSPRDRTRSRMPSSA